MTNPYDQRERDSHYTLCPDCGEDLGWHECGASPSERTLRIRELNDALRSAREDPALRIAARELMITPGVAEHGDDFIVRALEGVRVYSDFSPSNDPYGEHDFGKFQVDGYDLFWKIDYYDNDLENGSPNPADAALTKRVLTVLLAEEY
jgi:hypothetical protein